MNLLFQVTDIQEQTLLEERAAVGRAWSTPWCGILRSRLQVGLVHSRTPILSVVCLTALAYGTAGDTGESVTATDLSIQERSGGDLGAAGGSCPLFNLCSRSAGRDIRNTLHGGIKS